MFRHHLILGLFVALIPLSITQMAAAQYSGTRQSVSSQTRSYIINRPTVSPYVNLASRDSSLMPNYHTLVRPRVEADERNVQRQRQTIQLQQQINSLTNQVRETQAQQAGMMITGRVGWSSRGLPRFGTYLNFYPGFQRIPRR